MPADGTKIVSKRQQTARLLLRLWQQNLNCVLATDYLQAVWKLALHVEKNGNVIDAGDLPVP